MKLKEENNLIYNVNMFKLSQQQKCFFPCKHIFVKLKQEENLIYNINMYKQGHKQKWLLPVNIFLLN